MLHPDILVGFFSELLLRHEQKKANFFNVLLSKIKLFFFE